MNVKISKLLFSVLIFCPYMLFAEAPNGTKIVDLRYGNAEYKSQIFNLDKKNSEILNIGTHENEYFLLRAGVNIHSERANRVKTYFISNPKQEVCKGENIYDSSFVVGDINKALLEKIELFRGCIKFLVEDPQKNEIDFITGEGQDCKIEKLNNYSALLSGGDCFIKGKPDQILQVEIKTNPHCQDREFLKMKPMNPMEFDGVLQAFIYPKSEIGPVFVPTENLWNKNIHTNLNPGKELLELVTMSGNGEEEVFFRPSSFIFPDVMVSSLKIANQQNFGVVDLGLMISNIGGKVFCNSGLCSNYLNYDVPFAPLTLLFELDERTNRKYEIGASDRVGDRIPGQWNGEIESQIYFHNATFEKGKKYSFELIFSNPAEDFSRFKKYYRSLLKAGRMTLGGFKPGLDTIGTLGGFAGINGGIGEVPTLNSEGNFVGGIPDVMNLEISKIFETLEDPSFPPNYSKICNKNLSVCNRLSSKAHTKITIDFEVADIQNSRVVFKDDIKVRRVSDLLPELNAVLNLNNRPTIKCK